MSIVENFENSLEGTATSCSWISSHLFTDSLVLELTINVREINDSRQIAKRFNWSTGMNMAGKNMRMY